MCSPVMRDICFQVERNTESVCGCCRPSVWTTVNILNSQRQQHNIDVCTYWKDFLSYKTNVAI